MLDVDPKGALSVEPIHKCRMFTSDCVIVVIDQKTIGSLLSWSVHVAEISFETRDYLLERLFIDRTLGPARVKMNLIDAFRKKPCKTPARDLIGDISNKGRPLFNRKVNIRPCLLVVLFDLSVRFGILSSLELEKMRVSLREAPGLRALLKALVEGD